MTAYDIIKKPIITEKTEINRTQNNVYTFEVNKKANKVEIAKAVETIFNVKVVDVNTINIKPTTKRHGMKLYQTSLTKKAMVKVKEGDLINYFPEV